MIQVKKVIPGNKPPPPPSSHGKRIGTICILMYVYEKMTKWEIFLSQVDIILGSPPKRGNFTTKGLHLTEYSPIIPVNEDYINDI